MFFAIKFPNDDGTTDSTEKTKTCIFMLVAGISKTMAPVTNPILPSTKRKNQAPISLLQEEQEQLPTNTKKQIPVQS